MLKQLQGTIEEESGEACGSQLELIGRLKGEYDTSRRRSKKKQLSMCSLSFPPSELSLDSAGFKSRSRPLLAPGSTSSSSGAPVGAVGGSGAPGPSTSAAFPRRGLPSAGRDGHDRCLEELEKER